MVIGIDFDRTCVSHKFPYIGIDIRAVPDLKELVVNWHSLILWTMRSNGFRGNFLDDAINWFAVNEIPLYGIQTNPTQSAWSSSPKAYCQLYIDDAALRCPLFSSTRNYVDYVKVRKILVEKKIII